MEIKEGVVCTLRVTPALYGVASSRGIDLQSAGDNPLRTYVKMMYCSAINDWEIRQVDDPSLGDFPLSYSDFDDWAFAHQEEFIKVIDFMLLACTGKGIKDYQHEKKKRK